MRVASHARQSTNDEPGDMFKVTDVPDWTIRELAMYDLPALVDHVCQETGYDKVSAPSVPFILPLSCLLPKPHNHRQHLPRTH